MRVIAAIIVASVVMLHLSLYAPREWQRRVLGMFGGVGVGFAVGMVCGGCDGRRSR